MTNPAFGCVDNTIRLRSGKYFDLANPQPDQFEFADIAGALANICRFGGQCDGFYSVAEHCCHCERVADVEGHPLAARLAVLLHDATEAFIGDCVKPLKVMLPEYSVIEKRIEAVVAERFGVDFEKYKTLVSKLDHEMLIAERRSLFTPDKVTWCGEDQVRLLNIQFHKWAPDRAETHFVCQAERLGIAV